MRAITLTCASVLALAASPVLAQSSSQSGQQQGNTGSDSQTATAMTQQKLQSDLKKAGFTNISVLDAAYLVQADTSDGNQVMMLINPPTGSAGAGGSGSSGSSSGSSSTSSTSSQ
jgi:hypothetical protein